MKPEQSAFVQELLVLADEHPRVLGLLGALAQDRHDVACPSHRLAVAGTGEITTHQLRQRTHGIAPVAGARHDPFPL
jgi:hypothetical protein